MSNPAADSFRKTLDDIRERATLAAMVSPIHFFVIHGCSLNHYLAQIDKLEATLDEAEKRIEAAEA